MTVDLHSAHSIQNPSAGWLRLADVPQHIEVVPVQLDAEDGASSRGYLYRRRGLRPRTGVHLMHPRTDQSVNYNIVPLAEAGFAVLGRAGRWPNNDSSTTHEHLLLDLAAGIRYLKREGCESVALLGNSGGSALASYYQAQAELPAGRRHSYTPAGDPFDLNAFTLPPADGLALIAPHVGQGLILGKLIDGAVIDESNPLLTDATLDIYDAANGFVTPPDSSSYDPEFLVRYRAAQLARVARLDEIARGHVQRQRDAARELERKGTAASLATIRQAQIDPHMIIHRTSADPAFVDLAIEPDDRLVGSYFGKRPDLENFGPDGFARYLTPRAWLSTWSALSSRAKTIDNLAAQTAPLLVVHYAGDCGTRLSEAMAMHEKAGSRDKKIHIVFGVDHFGFGISKDGQRGKRSTVGTAQVVQWMTSRFAV